MVGHGGWRETVKMENERYMRPRGVLTCCTICPEVEKAYLE